MSTTKELKALMTLQKFRVNFESQKMSAIAKVNIQMQLSLEDRHEIMTQIVTMDRGYEYGLGKFTNQLHRLEHWETNEVLWREHHPVNLANKLIAHAESQALASA